MGMWHCFLSCFGAYRERDDGRGWWEEMLTPYLLQTGYLGLKLLHVSIVGALLLPGARLELGGKREKQIRILSGIARNSDAFEVS